MVVLALPVFALSTMAVRLMSSKETYRNGEPVALHADTANLSKAPIMFVQPSFEMMGSIRAPYWHLERRVDEGKWKPVWLLGGLCGNSDFSLHPNYFVSVSPGGAKPLIDIDGTLSNLWTRQMSVPGEYTFRLTYDTRPAPDKWLGYNGERLLYQGERDKAPLTTLPSPPWFYALYQQVPKGIFVSNEVTIRVLPPKP